MAEKAIDHDVLHHEMQSNDDNAQDKQGWNDARAANLDEHEMTIRQALVRYRSAVCWSLVVSMSIIMEGCDTNLIGNVSQMGSGSSP
jgi:MFS transporter, SP family, general alpha glucoside:H+ symporter